MRWRAAQPFSLGMPDAALRLFGPQDALQRDCDLIAEGVMIAVKQVGVAVPVVVRLEGTNAEQAREMLAHSALAITPASDLTDAAKKAVALAAGKK